MSLEDKMVSMLRSEYVGEIQRGVLRLGATDHVITLVGLCTGNVHHSSPLLNTPVSFLNVRPAQDGSDGNGAAVSSISKTT